MPPFLRPTKLPEWASGDTADVVEPTSGEKSLGWAAGQTPPAPYMNWLMGGDFGYFPWLQYVSTFEQQALTWPERQTFQKGFAASGTRSAIAGLDVTSGLTANGISPAAGTGLADTPYNDVPLPAPRFLTSRHIINASPLRYARAYLTATGYEYAVNAWWDDANSQWVADDTVSPAILFRLTGSSLRICRVDVPSAPFTDVDFTEKANIADSEAALASLSVAGAVTASSLSAGSGPVSGGTASFTEIATGAWIAAGSSGSPFGPNWGNGDVPVTFRKTPWGDVEFRGMAKAIGGTGNNTIMTLPVTHRPSAHRFVIVCGTAGSVVAQYVILRILSDTGAVTIISGAADVGAQFHLDSLRFSI